MVLVCVHIEVLHLHMFVFQLMSSLLKAKDSVTNFNHIGER